MFLSLTKLLTRSLLLVFVSYGATAHANSLDTLPDIGTTAGDTLSINQEIAIGDFYVRELRGNAPLIDDPLLTDYVNHVGQRLVAAAWSVKTPFHFYLIDNDQLNAFAFFGGNVVLHSALFRYTDDESQLASVMAHEISHVTQRHLARSMADQQRRTPLTWAGALGSILLAMANPQLGMATLTGTLAGAQQNIISFTQDNEREADRIGLQVLQRANFDPQSMATFMQKLADLTHYSTQPPEMLLTHPLPDNRLADARNRANQLPHPVIPSSADFYFAKVRILAMYGSGQNSAVVNDLLDNYARGDSRQQQAATYGRAILTLRAKNYDRARRLIAPLLAKSPHNLWFLDISSDIDIGLKQPDRAIATLSAIQSGANARVVQLNLANAYLAANQPQNALNLLKRYTWQYAEDVNGWDLLIQATGQLGLTGEQLFAQAQQLALKGQLQPAIRALTQASALQRLNSLQQARYDARIDQLRQLEQRFRQYQKQR